MLFFHLVLVVAQVVCVNPKKGLEKPKSVFVDDTTYPPVGPRLFKTTASAAVFDNPIITEPKQFWNYFLALVETPRGSGHQDIIKPLLVKWGNALGLDTKTDEVGNVIIRKAASPGCEAWPGICLQSHYDIVAIAREGVSINFLTDPIVPSILPAPTDLYINGSLLGPEYGSYILTGVNTSLGADDGTGVAATFSILEDNNLKHGPIEAIFTTDEETTMIGAEKVERQSLKSKYFINLESGRIGQIGVGCGGGFDQTLSFPFEKKTVEGVRIVIEIQGLKGGHSGNTINEGRANAIKLLAEAVDMASKAIGAQEILAAQSFVGGQKMNAIPSSGTVTLIVPSEKKTAFLTSFQTQTQKLQTEWETIEPGLQFTVTADASSQSHVSYDAPATRLTLDVIHSLPHGVLRMSPDVPDLVETSINLALVNLCADCANTGPSGCGVCDDKPQLRVDLLARGSDDKQMPFVQEKLETIARLGGGKASVVRNAYPGWRANLDSHLLAVAKQALMDLDGVEAEVYATHAGQEVGFFVDGSQSITEAISTGPYRTGAHTWDEALYIETVPRFYRLLVRILQTLDK